MTIDTAIKKTDDLMPNSVEQRDKVSWLSMLDGMVYRDIWTRHAGLCEREFDRYTPDTPVDTELLIPEPYDEIYRWFLEMHICDVNGEVQKYNNASAKYNTALLAYMDYVNRTHMPVPRTELKLW